MNLETTEHFLVIEIGEPWVQSISNSKSLDINTRVQEHIPSHLPDFITQSISKWVRVISEDSHLFVTMRGKYPNKEPSIAMIIDWLYILHALLSLSQPTQILTLLRCLHFLGYIILRLFLEKTWDFSIKK